MKKARKLNGLERSGVSDESGCDLVKSAREFTLRRCNVSVTLSAQSRNKAMLLNYGKDLI
jgi:hypothetical protein